MNTRIKVALSGGLALSLIGCGPIGSVVAHATGVHSFWKTAESLKAATVTTTETSPPSAGTQTTDDTQSMNTRIKARKDKLNIRLTATEQKRLLLVCKKSQGTLSSLSGRINGIQTSRTQVYGGIGSRLSELQSKLTTQGVDTLNLKDEISQFQSLVNTFDSDLSTYQQSVKDAGSMDCAADTTGFKATILTARTQLDTVRLDATAIRSYVTDTIKPTLQAIKQKLQTADTNQTGGAQ